MSSIGAWLYSQLLVTPRLPKVSFKDQVAVITGANRGLGLEATRQFIQLGASKVIMGVRSQSKGQAAKEDIEKLEGCPPSTIEVWDLDMSSFESVRNFAAKLSTLPRLDVLVASIGIQTSEFVISEGHESTVTTNVISTFLLAFLVLPKMKETASKFNTQPHLSIITSEVHHWSKFTAKEESSIFGALDDKDKSIMSARYLDTKLMEILVVRELFKSVIKTPKNYPVIINTVNPGFCRTDFATDSGSFFSLLKLLLGRKADVGSRTYVHAASVGSEGQGKYLSDCAVEPESAFVRSNEGRAVGKRVWDELQEILEEISPGILAGLV